VLVIRRATPAEAAEHDRILDLLDKASSGRTAWRILAENV
jgi:hypothetical protein